MQLRKKLAFISYLLRHGSIRNNVSSTETPEKDLLVNFKISISAKPVSFKYRFRKKLMQNVVIHNLWATAAYVKASLFYHPNYLISDSLRLIYTRVPKAASTFLAYEMMKKLEPSLPPSLPEKQINLLSPHYANRFIPIGKENFTSFSVVRNPFHRIVAVYREFFRRDQNENFIYEIYLFGILKREMTFKEFIYVVDLIPDFLKDRHFKPQSFILKEAKRKTNVRIFKLEEHSSELKSFLENYNLSMPKQEERSRSYDYRSYYDMETAQKVRSIYRQDIEDFGYENIWDDLVSRIKSTAT